MTVDKKEKTDPYVVTAEVVSDQGHYNSHEPTIPPEHSRFYCEKCNVVSVFLCV